MEVISFQKIYGLYGLKHHIVEIRGDVTMRDKQVKIELLSQWKLEAEFRKKVKLSSNGNNLLLLHHREVVVEAELIVSCLLHLVVPVL